MAEATTDEILSAVNNFANKVDKRFDKVEARLDSLDKRTGHLENQMVTKDYLDNKLADLRGDLVVAVRREDEKVDTLVGKLQEEDSLSELSAQEVLKIKPLART